MYILVLLLVESLLLGYFFGKHCLIFVKCGHMVQFCFLERVWYMCLFDIICGLCI